jgi:hypothetical protein
MSPAKAPADLDRKPFFWGGRTGRQVAVAAMFGVPALLLLMGSGIHKALTGRQPGLSILLAGLLGMAAIFVLGVPQEKGTLNRLHRLLLGPRTLVNGPVQTLPREFRTRSYRRAQRRVATLSAPFEGFDEQGRYVVGGGFCRVLKVNPIDMELRSERERHQLESRFAHLLNTTDGTLTIHVTSEPVSFAHEIERLRGLELRPQVNAEAADYADFLERLSGYRRQTYVACWAPDAMAADLRASAVAEQLRRMGLDVHWPAPSEVAALTALLSGGSVPHRSYPSAPTVKGV